MTVPGALQAPGPLIKRFLSQPSAPCIRLGKREERAGSGVELGVLISGRGWGVGVEADTGGVPEPLPSFPLEQPQTRIRGALERRGWGANAERTVGRTPGKGEPGVWGAGGTHLRPPSGAPRAQGLRVQCPPETSLAPAASQVRGTSVGSWDRRGQGGPAMTQAGAWHDGPRPPAPAEQHPPALRASASREHARAIYRRRGAGSSERRAVGVPGPAGVLQGGGPAPPRGHGLPPKQGRPGGTTPELSLGLFTQEGLGAGGEEEEDDPGFRGPLMAGVKKRGHRSSPKA